MIYLESLKIKPGELPNRFPFDASKLWMNLHFVNPVTFLVRENGSGKSTQTIACGLKCSTIGSSDVNQDETLMGQRFLAQTMRLNAVKDDCQFIIAIHSPIMMALPAATILSFDHLPICPIAWDEVEHVCIIRAFLNDPL